MTRDWQPGDVAMVRLDSETEIRVWYTNDGWRGVKGSFYDLHLSARPLVVLDPEDREQVERLASLYVGRLGPGLVDLDDCMQAALREFANPKPPIKEPSNRLAIVRDRGGDEWVHVGERVWRSITSTGAYMVEKHWHDTGSPLDGNVVEIVAPGVTP